MSADRNIRKKKKIVLNMFKKHKLKLNKTIICKISGNNFQKRNEKRS